MVSVHGCSASINILSSADCSTGTILVFYDAAAAAAAAAEEWVYDA